MQLSYAWSYFPLQGHEWGMCPNTVNWYKKGAESTNNTKSLGRVRKSLLLYLYRVFVRFWQLPWDGIHPVDVWFRWISAVCSWMTHVPSEPMYLSARSQQLCYFRNLMKWLKLRTFRTMFNLSPHRRPDWKNSLSGKCSNLSLTNLHAMLPCASLSQSALPSSFYNLLWTPLQLTAASAQWH